MQVVSLLELSTSLGLLIIYDLLSNTFHFSFESSVPQFLLLLVLFCVHGLFLFLFNEPLLLLNLLSYRCKLFVELVFCLLRSQIEGHLLFLFFSFGNFFTFWFLYTLIFLFFLFDFVILLFCFDLCFNFGLLCLQFFKFID